MTTQGDIRGWLERGLNDPDKPTHVIVMCDSFDHSDYPVYVYPGQDVREVEKNKTGNMQYPMEVYNLALPIDAQLAERRAFNY